MNADEIGSAVRKIAVALLSAYAAQHGATEGLDVNFWAGVAGDVAVMVWGVYAHWNMKKVPEDARVVNK